MATPRSIGVSVEFAQLLWRRTSNFLRFDRVSQGELLMRTFGFRRRQRTRLPVRRGVISHPSGMAVSIGCRERSLAVGCTSYVGVVLDRLASGKLLLTTSGGRAIRRQRRLARMKVSQ